MIDVIISLVFIVIFLWSWKQLDTADNDCRSFLYAIMVISGLGCWCWVLALGGII